MQDDAPRLARLTPPAKLLLTLFLLIVGPGYLFGTANIFFQHQGADLDLLQLIDAGLHQSLI